jgi:hypothetical protein
VAFTVFVEGEGCAAVQEDEGALGGRELHGLEDAVQDQYWRRKDVTWHGELPRYREDSGPPLTAPVRELHL